MEKTGAKKGEFIKELLKDFLVAIVIVFLITLVIKPTIVKETSMLDTLQPNNYLILNKLAYVGDRSPERGDIIVFESELENEDTGKNMLLIKRVIGIEGDEISESPSYLLDGVMPMHCYVRDAEYDLKFE